MLTTFIFIGIPIFFVLAGALAALTLSTKPLEEEGEVEAIRVPDLQPDLQAVALASAFDDTVETAEEPSVEELLVRIEAHLRRERQAAASFAQNPSHETLWIN